MAFFTHALGVGFGRVVCEGLSCHFHTGQLFEDPDKVFPWINSAAAATLDQCIPNGVGLSGCFTAHEEPIFCSEFGGSDSVFDEVIIDFQSSVFEAAF